MAKDRPIRTTIAIAKNADNQTPSITAGQRLVMFAFKHPNVLKVFIRTRQFHTGFRRRINGMAASAKIVEKR